MNLPPTGSATDVSIQVMNSHLIYGASDNTNPQGLSASKSLNYANGPSMQRPIIDRVTVIPFTLHYNDTIGLFGAENCFVRVDLDLQTLQGVCYEEPDWECALVTRVATAIPYYDDAVIDVNQDLTIVNTYEPAQFNNNIGILPGEGVASVDLFNNKTGNQYVDDWLDVRLYTLDGQEHAYDRLYVGLKSSFYVGFHARNTRRLPYDVSIEIGNVITKARELPRSERRYLPVGLQGNLGCANQAY